MLEMVKCLSIHHAGLREFSAVWRSDDFLIVVASPAVPISFSGARVHVVKWAHDSLYSPDTHCVPTGTYFTSVIYVMFFQFLY